MRVWIEDLSEPPYLLLVQHSMKYPDIVVMDPGNGNKVIFRSADYKEIQEWLWEDEFTMVKGRIEVDK